MASSVEEIKNPKSNLNPFAESFFPFRLRPWVIRPYVYCSVNGYGSKSTAPPNRGSASASARRRPDKREWSQVPAGGGHQKRKGIYVQTVRPDEATAGVDNVACSESASGGNIELHGCTSLMIKNIPCKARRIDLVAILDDHCRRENKKQGGRLHDGCCLSAYDFLYLPMDFKTNLNLGYAFVNFTSTVAALRFYQEFNHGRWRNVSTKKVIEVSVAHIQGVEAYKRRFKHSIFPCKSNEFLPAVFVLPRNGFERCEASDVGIRMPVSHASKVKHKKYMRRRNQGADDN